MTTQKRQKKYPMDGPPLAIQRIGLKANPTAEDKAYIKSWLSEYAKKNGRPETVNAYKP